MRYLRVVKFTETEGKTVGAGVWRGQLLLTNITQFQSQKRRRAPAMMAGLVTRHDEYTVITALSTEIEERESVLCYAYFILLQ